MSLKENLIKKMKDKSLKIRELSSLTGISEPTLKRLRTDSHANPTLDVLMKLSNVLDVPIDALVSSSFDNIPTFEQGTLLDKEHTPEKFIMLILYKTFDLSPGTKVLFERYREDNVITKYIVGADSRIYKKLDSHINHYLSDKQSVVVIEKSQVLAVINREIYEVSYAQI